MIEHLKKAHRLLLTKLSKEGYHADCKCRSCDALRSIDEAKGEIEQAIAETLFRENPSPESQAQARSQEMGGGSRPLAVAVEIAFGRFDLWFDGKRVCTGNAAELMMFARAAGYGIIHLIS